MFVNRYLPYTAKLLSLQNDVTEATDMEFNSVFRNDRMEPGVYIFFLDKLDGAWRGKTRRVLNNFFFNREAHHENRRGPLAPQYSYPG